MSSRQNFLSLRLNFVVSMIENTQILFLESKGELEKKQKNNFLTYLGKVIADTDSCICDDDDDDLSTDSDDDDMHNLRDV